jgi:hypothetical protein
VWDFFSKNIATGIGLNFLLLLLLSNLNPLKNENSIYTNGGGKFIL